MTGLGHLFGKDVIVDDDEAAEDGSDGSAEEGAEGSAEEAEK